MNTPANKTIALTFMSHPTKKLEMRWKAVLTFPPGSNADSVLPITLEDGNGAPIAEAEFEFAGQRLKVKDGKTTISYADFIRGKSEVALWVYRAGMLPIPGGLTFA